MALSNSIVSRGSSPRPSVTTGAARRKKKVTQACVPCRNKRSKCDAQTPVCSACSNRKIKCTYSEVDGRKGKLKKEEQDALREKTAKLEDIFQSLSSASGQDALTLLQRLQLDPSFGLSQFALPTRHVLDERQRSSQQVIEFRNSVRVHRPTLGARAGVPGPLSYRTKAQGLGTYEDELKGQAIRVYGNGNLPPGSSIISSIAAFFDCSHALFYICERHEMDDIYDRVYRQRESLDNATLCELCAFTAVGSRYYTDEFDPSVMEALYCTAKLYVEDSVQSNFLRGMRATLCMSMYSLLTKPTSARLWLSSGLHVARSADLLKDQWPRDLWVSYCRLYGSFVFLECWLSSRLGYQAAVSRAEMEFTTQEIRQLRYPVESQIQARFSVIGFIMAGISQDIYKSTPTTFAIVEKYSQLLSQWRGDLPHEIQPFGPVRGRDYVTSEQDSRSIILLHIVYFGAQMLVQRRLLAAIAQCKMEERWTLDGEPDQGAKIQQQCVEAAETCVYLLGMLKYTRNTFRRYWLCIDPASTACSVLLFDAAWQLLNRQRDRAQVQLDKSKECINILDGYAEATCISMKMHQILLPLYQDLRLAETELSSRRRSTIYDLLENPRPPTAHMSAPSFDGGRTSPIHARVIPAMYRIIEVLENPDWRTDEERKSSSLQRVI
ncbi:hypothetical protein, variant 1 [Cladophialophora immunda]|uniref:Zn(2)-C6 fungal-type domain-containing protein n=1 Tax=Cladophialophora immunda TaxID=569365 RepID=A0A0D2CE97_9EURO|nr:hypothetical protein, variant 1 [Cladophialophora immunda]KIW21874.1 hypothetical protein, variant 1 [Cladophialophora immunda]